MNRAERDSLHHEHRANDAAMPIPGRARSAMAAMTAARARRLPWAEIAHAG